MKRVVTVEEAKAFLRLSDSAEDGVVGLCLDTAHQAVETFLGQRFLTQECTWQVAPPRSRITLPYGPVQSILKVEWHKTSGAPLPCEFTWHDRTVHIKAPQIAGNAIHITYRCGYGDKPEHVPAALRHGVLLACAHVFEHRGDTLPAQPIWQQMMDAYRLKLI